ncbi:MAG: DUF4249 domain-containing protein [Mariniphaga sp.]|nr:DUF4249 domain-containing protein [Mariniphaga sp.]
MKHRFVLILFVVIITSGCQKEFDLKLDFSPGFTVNGILDPDSTIKVKISKTEKIGHPGEFQPVDIAVVELIDENQVFKLPKQMEGIYADSLHVHAGKTYNLNVFLPNNKILSAETTIPSKPVATVVHNPDVFIYTITLTDNTNEKNYYWVYAQSGYFQSNFMKPASKIFNENNIIYTNSVIGDEFNRVRTKVFPDTDYSYSFGMRIPDESISDGSITFDIKISEGWNRLERISIVSADKNLDNYLKTGLLQRDQKAGGDTPVFMIPISMFTNIKNGKGIFGSCSISVFDFEFYNEQSN